MSPSSIYHTPVLVQEVLDILCLQPGKSYVDATLGGGGHAQKIIEQIAPNGTLIAMDQDPDALAYGKALLQKPDCAVHFLHGNFSEVTALCKKVTRLPLTGGLLADLGISSHHVDSAPRGFSFLKEAALDMRMNPETSLTAADILAQWSAKELQHIFSTYGEERRAKTLAQAIVTRRNREGPFQTTTEFSGFIETLLPRPRKNAPHKTSIHPATKVFQALRIAVNDELGHLERLLEQLPHLLAPGARVAIISFHSLEDRCVKKFLQQASRSCMCPPDFPVCQCNHTPTFSPLTNKPIQASPAEVAENPRARSAKLRGAVRL